jgi:3-methyladenine DNA glycosylase/8-oxoguanine DNA glycosylase
MSRRKVNKTSTDKIGQTALSLDIPRPYDFASTVRDHGWIALLPCRWLGEENVFERVERLENDKVVLLHISAEQTDQASLAVHVQTEQALSTKERQEIGRNVRWMLRLDEDLTEFYGLVASHPTLNGSVTGGRGRLLRSPSLFEDAVKTICTTNTTWSQTKQMVARIVNRLGDPFPQNPERRAFPTPAQIAGAGETVFAADIRLGYRDAYVLQLAREVVEGKRDLEALKVSDLPLKELKRELKTIKGVGDYAAHTLLMILGRYDEVAVDTELRSHVNRVYGKEKTMPDRELAAIYEQWGRWRYLVYWYEMITS